jgi:two-component system chemotaxis response regulator CheB
MTVFARQLSVAAGREAVVAEDGTKILPDRIVIAPGEAHLLVDDIGGKLVARLLQTKVASGCMPSVDPMLASAGRVLGGGALGVVLTGMGRDGVDGARRLVEAGGAVMAQDEQSSAVWGMPRAIADAGLACAVLPPDKLARRVAGRVEEGLCK